ncbi:MAG TPA: Stp1/IreP family PP2C-type Ser/Thr phosphatase [Acidimicrobiales bacterium]|nr:Stp1/IreP family PP2C-type Ser/Thr phosphatase [Acidimicrobiales bacterium]
MTSLRWGSATDTGLVRRNNQDHLLVDGRLFAVADGMGGHAAGEVASQVAIDALRSAFEATGDNPHPDDLVGAVRQANSAVIARAETDPALRGMGTTLTAAAVVVEDDEERIAIANVGDSRAYVFAHGDLTQLTEDHNVAEELARSGQINPEDVGHHPQRHILTRAIGIFPDVDVDVWEVLPYPGDRVLLCSDGLVREVNDDQIAAVLRRLGDPGEAAQELVARARAAGGSDNITVVLIDVVDGHPVAPGAAGAAESRPTGTADADVSVHAAGRGGKGGAAAPVLVRPVARKDGPLHRRRKPEPKVRDEAPRAAADPGPSEARPTVPRRRRVTVRVVVFVVVLVALVVAALFAVAAYARGSYFVTLGLPGTAPPSPLATPASRPLVIERGRPGGLLWFEPTIVERTQVLSDEVLPSRLPQLRDGQVEPSLKAARTFVSNLIKEAAQAAPQTTTP